MKKTEIKNTLEALIKNEVSPETLVEVMKVIDQLGRKATVDSRPKEIEVDGKTYKWCIRHNQYEPIEWFINDSKGNVKPECYAATLRWRQYGKDINAAIKSGDATLLGELTLKRKSHDYDFKSDVKDFADKLKEDGFKINPKNIIKEEDAK